MSTSPEKECSDQSTSPAAGSGSGQKSTSNAAENGKHTAGEKTISCVSCRRRKLRCDRRKPACSTCERLRHTCEYPERRRNLGTKRRNMKELEARLAQVETQLVSESKTKSKDPALADINTGGEWDTLGVDMNVDFDGNERIDPVFDMLTLGFESNSTIPEEYQSQELLALGLTEPLPPDDMIDELHQIYFSKLALTQSMIHKYRYFASMSLAPNSRPPACLRYAIWALASSVSDKYRHLGDALYERARRYAEAAEMRGYGETFVTVAMVQAWVLIGNFEAKNAYFTRAWMSAGRAVRLAFMLGLQRLDGGESDMKIIIPPPKDWIELEERRRSFWGTFYSDRWASSGTGWPMMIDEKDIFTNLPSSEAAFENGIEETGIYLAAALTPEGASQITAMGAVVLSACLFGHNFQHLHRVTEEDQPGDLANGAFWKRHRQMDNVLSSTFMFLPDHLRLAGNMRDMNIVFFHMNIHTSSICLHQSAVLTAMKHGVNPAFIRQSQARSLMAAEEIANIMRLVSHFDASDMNSWIGFCLYVAAGVFLADERKDRASPNSRSNLEFILTAMRAIGKTHTVTQHFIAQIELDLDASGVGEGWLCRKFHAVNKPQTASLKDESYKIGANDLCMAGKMFRNTQELAIGRPRQMSREVRESHPLPNGGRPYPGVLAGDESSGSDFLAFGTTEAHDASNDLGNTDSDFALPSGRTPSSESSSTNMQYPLQPPHNSNDGGTYQTRASPQDMSNWGFDPNDIVPFEQSFGISQGEDELNALLDGVNWESLQGQPAVSQ